MFTITSDQVYFAGEGFSPATLRIEGGRIAAVARAVDKTADIDARGRFVTPGFIDPHSHIGVDETEAGLDQGDTNEIGQPVAAELRASDAIFPRDPAFADARAAGVTTVGVFPGSANPIGGLGCAVHTAGRTVAGMLLRDPVGMKFAFGENIKNVAKSVKKGPGTRMANAALLRRTLLETEEWAKKPKKERKGRDLAKEALARLLACEFPARMHAHRDDDIMVACRIAGEFGLDFVIEHASSAHLVMAELASAGASLVIGPTKSAKKKIETRDKTFRTAVEAWRAGVPFALTVDHPVIPIEMLPVAAAMCVREGLPETAALDAITAVPARILGLAKETGRVAKGLLADLVVTAGHPLDARSAVDLVLVAGETAYAK